MLIVAALGGNALLRRGQALTAENQRANVRIAAAALAELIQAGHDLVIAHGNGPQVGLLALQSAAYKPEEAYPLDVLGAETEGMIGYMIEQELTNQLPEKRPLATLLTQIEVDPADPAFLAPSKPIGPLYDQETAERLAEARGWAIASDGDRWRRVVPSPRPKRILEIGVIDLLIRQGVIVICAGGGGIPVMVRPDGALVGVEAVIDKDLAGGLLAREVGADIYLMLTDVAAVERDWGTEKARPIRLATPDCLGQLEFAAGSMGPKVQAACEFVEFTGRPSAIGRLADALGLVEGTAGTRVVAGSRKLE